MDNSLSDLQNTLNNSLKFVNDIVFRRVKKISFTILFFYLSQLVSDPKKSSTIVSSDMEIKKICSASNKAYIKRRNLVPAVCFQLIFDDLLGYYYKFHNILLYNAYRILAIDGTHSPVSKDLSIDDYKTTKRNTYVDLLISGIYDVYNKTIIDLSFTQTKNEREIYLSQLNYLQDNDIVIHDRGYYSKKLLYLIHKKGAFPIFRMKKGNGKNDIVNRFIANGKDDSTYKIKYKKSNEIINLRLIKYTIENTEVILGTTLTNEVLFNIDVLKKLYGDRWNIEVYFKTIKYDMSFKDFHSKSDELIRQEIEAHKCMTLLTRIMEEIYIHNNINIKNKMHTHHTNFKNNIDKTINEIIKELLFGGTYAVDNIINCLRVLFKTLLKIRLGRKYARIRITPPSNWYLHPKKIK